MIEKEVVISAAEPKRIAVIGGGFFGIMSALKLSERGFDSVILEKNKDIIRGASYINQNRVHMGYHYPRSHATAKSTAVFSNAFKKMFNECVVDNFDHYYAVAKHGSKVSAKEYLDFCDKIGLPYVEEYPQHIELSKDEIELSIKVPENIYDANLLRKLLHAHIASQPRIKLSTESDVIAIDKHDRGYSITYRTSNGTKTEKFDAVINATYGNLNRFVKMAGFEAKIYQYELVEVPVVKAPWPKRCGCGVMDGPFFGILPFGLSEDYLLYDVELSVLERCFAQIPSFDHGIEHYDQKHLREERFQKYIAKAKKYMPNIVGTKHLYSIYVTRMVLPNTEKDDARPTELLYHGPGFWSIFSGKISAAIPASETLALAVEDFFKGEKGVGALFRDNEQ